MDRTRTTISPFRTTRNILRQVSPEKGGWDAFLLQAVLAYDPEDPPMPDATTEELAREVVRQHKLDLEHEKSPIDIDLTVEPNAAGTPATS
jgi:hypothetical protein